MVSRRAALRTLATTAGLAGVAGCALFGSHSDTVGPNDNPPKTVGTDWAPPTGTWPLPAAGPRNTRHSSLPVDAPPIVAWRTQPSSDTDQRPTLHIGAATREMVYTAGPLYKTGKGIIVARNATDGRVRWRAQIGDLTDIGGVVGGTLYASSAGRKVHALDASTGQSRWHVDAYTQLANAVPQRYLTGPAALRPQLLPTPGAVYMTTSYGLHGLAPNDGSERWRAYVPQGKNSSMPSGVAVTNDVVVGSYRSGSVKLVALADGHVRTTDASWADPAWFDHISDPVLIGDKLSISLQGLDSPGSLPAIAAGYRNSSKVDEPHWQFPGPDDSDGPTQVMPPATDGERLFLVQFAPAGNRFRVATIALDASDGTRKWLHETPVAGDRNAEEFSEYVIAAPAIAGDVVLVGLVTSVADGKPDSTTGQLLALDAGEGHKRWQVPLGVVPTEVVVAGDRIYVAGLRGEFIALDRSGSA